MIFISEFCSHICSVLKDQNFVHICSALKDPHQNLPTLGNNHIDIRQLVRSIGSFHFLEPSAPRKWEAASLPALHPPLPNFFLIIHRLSPLPNLFFSFTNACLPSTTISETCGWSYELSFSSAI